MDGKIKMLKLKKKMSVEFFIQLLKIHWVFRPMVKLGTFIRKEGPTVKRIKEGEDQFFRLSFVRPVSLNGQKGG